VVRLANIVAWLLAPAMLVAMITVTGPAGLMGDFRAFYCAGAAIGDGANPYLQEPLHTCEVHTTQLPAPAYISDVTVPAPLPPVVLLAFVPLSRLPFGLASAVYGLLLLAASSFAVVLFAQATGVSTMVLNLAFATITATQTYLLGQPMPFVLLALAAAAVCVRKCLWTAASACAVAAIVEPHIALPVLIAMLAGLPRTRLPIVAFTVLAGLLGAAAVGFPVSIAYLRDVIPAHAISNAYEWQFSLTSVLTSIGTAAPEAVRAGEAMYAAMVAAGVIVAHRMWRASGDVAALVLIPPAFAVFGGVHVHLVQIVVAFPAILAVHAHYPRLRNIAATGVTLAMIPWHVISASVMTGFTPLLVGWFARATMDARRGLILTGVAAAIAISVLGLAWAGFGPGDTHFVPHIYPPDALAESSWGDFSRAILARPSLLLQWMRVPVLAGLGLGLIAITRAAFGKMEAV
jgi:hypothetical protein